MIIVTSSVKPPQSATITLSRNRGALAAQAALVNSQKVRTSGAGQDREKEERERGAEGDIEKPGEIPREVKSASERKRDEGGETIFARFILVPGRIRNFGTRGCGGSSSSSPLSQRPLLGLR